LAVIPVEDSGSGKGTPDKTLGRVVLLDHITWDAKTGWPAIGDGTLTVTEQPTPEMRNPTFVP
jgi:hypothetical protein